MITAYIARRENKETEPEYLEIGLMTSSGLNARFEDAEWIEIASWENLLEASEWLVKKLQRAYFEENYIETQELVCYYNQRRVDWDTLQIIAGLEFKPNAVTQAP